MWDLLQNTFFCLDSILLRQGPTRFTIGGFLSAQIMILWAIFRQAVLFSFEGITKHMKKVQSALSGMGMPQCIFTPGPQLTFPQHVVLPKRKTFFSSYGMCGWFDQQQKTLGWVQLGDTKFELQLLGLWDSYPSGRFGHIITAAPKRVRPLLTAHFKTMNPREVMLAETSFFQGCLPDLPPIEQAGPTVLLSRFMDNNYIGYVNFESATMRQQVVLFSQVFLDILYNIPMKWEPSGPVNDWCESRVITSPELILLMKGVLYKMPDTPDPQPNVSIWDRWVDRDSPNVSSVLQSMMPTVSSKALTYARIDLHMQINLASIVQGCAYKGYARSWWWHPLRATVKGAGKDHLLPASLVAQWVGEGRGFRSSVVPARALHFAPALQTS